MIVLTATMGCGFPLPAKTFFCEEFMACNRNTLPEKSPYRALDGDISYNLSGTTTTSGVSLSNYVFSSPSPSAKFEG